MALTTLWCEMLLHRDILREDHDASEAMKVLDRVFLCREADTVAFDLIGYHLNWRYCGKSGVAHHHGDRSLHWCA